MGTFCLSNSHLTTLSTHYNCRRHILQEDWRVISSWVGYICVFVQLVLGNYLLLGDVEMLSTENTHYGRAKSIMMARGGIDHLDGWNPALYDIDDDDEEETSVEGSGEEDALSLKMDPTNSGTYLSIEAEPSQQQYVPTTTTYGHRQPQGRHSTAHDAWASIYGLGSGRSSPQRHSLFHLDS